MKTIRIKNKILWVAFLLAMVSCGLKKERKTPTESDVYYTCSMDPQIKENEPGKCPICKMELTAVRKDRKQQPDEIRLSAQQVQLGNIQVDSLNTGSSGDQMTLMATVNFDRKKETVVSARIRGRVDRLYYKATGDFVSRGAKLYDLYSEELNNAQQEYLLAVEKQKVLGNGMVNFGQLIQAAKNKLLLWGMTENQIADLQKNGKASPRISFYSTTSGYVTQLNVREGDYVAEGGTVVTLADLSTLWVEAQVYASQLASLDRNAWVKVQFPDAPGREVSGHIEFVNPEINPDTRINLVRVSIANPGNRLQPGMPAYVFISNQEHKALRLPVDAVLRDAKGAMVWVQKAKDTYQYKMVTLGAENQGWVEIKSGLQKEDIVVISGAYLLNSEFIFKNGANPMAGMKM
ncbi:MAG: efflux RND transporter periplasmic adaptor subunit [Bacteroidota bacterium]|nr:efflux RND transporter periplasmic adaptor subunit [Bacteroidota bacterium]